MIFLYLYIDMTIKHFLIVTLLFLQTLLAHAFALNNTFAATDTIRFDDGSWYVGGIADSLFNGYGKMVYPDGMVYEGEWLKGLWNGKGKLSYPDGDSYNGQFLNHEFCGLGTYIYANGDTYNGYWEHSMFNGAGTMEYANGSTYSGSWKNDKKDGIGILFDAPTGVLIKGYFENDQFIHPINYQEETGQQEPQYYAYQENHEKREQFHCKGDITMGFSYGFEQLFFADAGYYFTDSFFAGLSLGFCPTVNQNGYESITYDQETGQPITLVGWDWYPDEILTEETYNIFRLAAVGGLSWKWLTLGTTIGMGFRNTIRNCRSLEHNDSYFEPGTLYYRKQFDGVAFSYNVFADIVISRTVRPFYACSMRAGYGNLEGFFMGLGFVF